MAAEQSISRDRVWYAGPLALLLVAMTILLAAAPWPLMFATLAPAAVAHAAIYDWSLRRPDLFPAIFAFLLGFLLDVVSGDIFGLGALTCVLAHYGAAAQRRFLARRGLAHAWVGLAATALLIAPVAWVVASAYVGQAQPLGAVVALTLLTAALYPAAVYAFRTVRAVAGLGERAP